ncbi:MAG: RNB domain-containing ribonuclease [Corynebacterium sp.]|uniref:RNB domain-containing ribonuclease n=1 Tax=Corynebacterium sp. TaxID=1720 RepID=UPI0026DFE3AD|nr:RNB domain-containing ribonuclease [Corynebacterium sp.]MDO5669139.1 RNB domain-containing ribonuclease [Corynebacterium sp.]
MKLYAAPLNFRGIAEEFSVPTEFSPELHAEAAAATDRFAGQRRDARDLPLVTIDPVGSMDLDQAVHIERRGDGYRVHYAIADVAAFIEPGSALEAESLRRGQTIYLPDAPARLHPEELSEGSASLLPDVDRPAVLWTFDLDSAGEVESFHLERALVHSVARLDYDGVHEDYLAGNMHPAVELLPEVGQLREVSGLRRKAINLRLPSQRVRALEDGTFDLIVDPRHEVMDWNSEISLLTGMCAGQLMVSHGAGILRTLRPATSEAEDIFRAEARALGYELADDRAIGDFLQSIDATQARGMAIMREAQKLLRGSGYVNLAAGEAEVHSGIGGYYSHVTAPLRRLVDRFATEYCLAHCAGHDVPAWVSERADEVVDVMRRTSALANNVDRAALDLTEATVLAPWVGHNFDAVVLTSDAERERARIFVSDPPVLADTIGAPPQGTRTRVSLVRADVDTRDVAFAWPAD